MKTNYEEITAEIEAKRAREDAVLHVYRTLDIERETLSQEKKKLQYDIEEKATGSASIQKLSRIEETEKVINALLDYIKRVYLYSTGTTTKNLVDAKSPTEAKSPCAECNLPVSEKSACCGCPEYTVWHQNEFGTK